MQCSSVHLSLNYYELHPRAQEACQTAALTKPNQTKPVQYVCLSFVFLFRVCIFQQRHNFHKITSSVLCAAKAKTEEMLWKKNVQLQTERHKTEDVRRIHTHTHCSTKRNGMVE